MKKLLVTSIFTIMMVAGLASVLMAGHHYHGYNMQMSDMSAMDSDGDGMITFDEFSAPTVDRLKSGFDMLDTDDSGKIDEKEWNEYLKVHGFNVGSES
jgi:Ca2+-binding EF-hand superfamily protein